jgi:hypothetical protein
LSPGRRTNRKNLRSCQRTILLYSFYKFSQRKITLCNYMYFQSSAARPQGHDRIWCRRQIRYSQMPLQMSSFALCIDRNRCEVREEFYVPLVKITHFRLPARDLVSNGIHGRALTLVTGVETPVRRILYRGRLDWEACMVKKVLLSAMGLALVLGDGGLFRTRQAAAKPSRPATEFRRKCGKVETRP